MPGWWPTPGRPQQRPARRAREGNRGTTLHPARPAHTPHTGSSDKPLPDLPPPYGPHTPPGAGLGIPRSVPLSRRRSRRSRWSARSEARTNDLEVRRGGGHTRPRGRPPWDPELAPETTTAKENPGNRLTATAKRTRYARRRRVKSVRPGPRITDIRARRGAG